MPNAGEFDAVLQYLKNKLPQLGFFSTLDEAVRAAPFEKAPAQQWQNYLKPGLTVTRNGIQFPLKAEELRYSPLSNLGQLDPEGAANLQQLYSQRLGKPVEFSPQSVSKDALLAHIHTHRPAFNLHLGVQGTDEDDLANRLPEHDLDQRATIGSSRYDDYAHKPGVPSSYEESVTRSPDFGQFSSHFGPTDLSWSRTTRHYLDDDDFATRNTSVNRPRGPTARLVEEIQSDRHQKAAEKAFLPTPEQADERNQILESLPPGSAPYDNPEGNELKSRLIQLEKEMQRRRGYRTPEEEEQLANHSILGDYANYERVQRTPPDTPFKDPADYGLLELKKQLLNSIHQGDSHLALIDPQSQIERYGTNEARDSGMQHVYGNVYPSALKKLARMYGANVVDLPLSIRSGQSMARNNLPEIMQEHEVDTPWDLLNSAGDAGPDVYWNAAAELLSQYENRLSEEPLDPRVHQAMLRGRQAIVTSNERDLTQGEQDKFEEALNTLHNAWIDKFPPVPEQTQKTFPALEITPEVAQKVQSTGIPFFKRGGEAVEHFDDGGSVDDSQQQTLSPQQEIPGIPEGEMMAFQEMPPAMLTQMTLDRIKNLYQPAMQMPAYGEGGAVADFADNLDKYLDEIADEYAARQAEAAAKAPHAPRPPLVQTTEDPLVKAAFETPEPAPLNDVLTEGFSTKKQAFADGGSTGGDYHSSLNWLKKTLQDTGKLGYFGTHIPLPGLDLIKLSPNAEARIAVRAAQQLYGVDKNGNPVFLGGILHKGATPPGIVDEVLSIPDSISGLSDQLQDLQTKAGLGPLVKMPKGDPFAWSKHAADRLAALNAAVAKDTGIGAPQTLGETAEDFAGQLAPLVGASRLAKEGTLARRALDQIAGWAGSGSSAPSRPNWINEDVGSDPVADAVQ